MLPASYEKYSTIPNSVNGSVKIFYWVIDGDIKIFSVIAGFHSAFSPMFALFTMMSSEFVGCILKSFSGNVILALLNPAVNLNWVAPVDPSLQFKHGELQTAISWDRTIIATVALLPRIVGSTGAEVAFDFILFFRGKLMFLFRCL